MEFYKAMAECVENLLTGFSLSSQTFSVFAFNFDPKHGDAEKFCPQFSKTFIDVEKLDRIFS